jgi:hypothetical protein
MQQRAPTAHHGYRNEDAFDQARIMTLLLAPHGPTATSGRRPTQHETCSERTEHHQWGGEPRPYHLLQGFEVPTDSKPTLGNLPIELSDLLDERARCIHYRITCDHDVHCVAA